MEKAAVATAPTLAVDLFEVPEFVGTIKGLLDRALHHAIILVEEPRRAEDDYRVRVAVKEEKETAKVKIAEHGDPFPVLETGVENAVKIRLNDWEQAPVVRVRRVGRSISITSHPLSPFPYLPQIELCLGLSAQRPQPAV